MTYTSEPPLRWYQAGRGRRPFDRFFALDPSENPTVRPVPAEPATRLERVPGEEWLVIVGRSGKPRRRA